ncbi:YadA family autotransporter adhesin [Variovorax paradoxus]|uniref:YadA family autotransporter adhesin n=1 Tax=Variovorax paradoxus TaxID=34073 RepID=UPI001F5FC9CA|nr:YadA-like family protein [Variovorax paradoxus]
MSFGAAGQTRGLVNVSAGAVTAASTDAVNGSQLYTVQQTANTAVSAASAAQGTADSALGLAQNSAQYGAGGTSLQLNANGGAGTTISNVGAGQVATDAANVGQVQQAQQTAITTANNFTVQQVTALQALMNQALSSGVCAVGAGGAVACGPGAGASGAGSTSMGTNAQANGQDTVAVGNGAQASHAGSVAIGAGARALADPTTALGNNAVATGNNAVALGANTLASGSNAVALGQGSVADRDNTVSVGNAAAGLLRGIANVAPGLLGTDAVNVNQLQQAVSNATSQANAFAAQGVAAALAMPSMPTLAVGKKWMGAAVGNYAGAAAVGFAFGYQVSDNFNLGLGVSTATSSGSSNRIAARVQAGYAW